ncbi:MAG TPA: threonine/serine exporter family protein [Thermoanaerobaculia bacterium]|nr:threonine/serine exporter family protein [Thermoanaerobaculia bacterium]
MTAPAAAPPRREKVAFLITLARALHSLGSPAHRLEGSLAQIASGLGVPGQFFATPTAIFAALGEGEANETILIRAEPGSTDLERLCLVEDVMQDVEARRMTPREARERVDAVMAGPDRYPSALVPLAFALASAAAARFFGGGVPEVVTAGAVGLVIGLLSLLPGPLPAFRGLFEAVAAVVAAATATALSRPEGFAGLPGVAGHVVILAGLIVLIPGLSLTVSMTELATRNLVCGSARLAGALTVFLTLGFGVALGQWLGRAAFGLAVALEPVALPAWTELPSLMVSAAAFLVLFRARPRDYGWILLAAWGALAGARLGSQLLGPQLGAFFGALLVGSGSNLLARLRGRPAAVTQLPGLMLLVPGSLGFNSVASLLAEDVQVGVQAAFTMTLVAAALVTGILLANVVVPPRRLL